MISISIWGVDFLTILSPVLQNMIYLISFLYKYIIEMEQKRQYNQDRR